MNELSYENERKVWANALGVKEPLQSNEEEVDEIDLQTQLNVALQLMTKEQYNTWGLELSNIQLQCSLMDAKRKIDELKKELEEARK